MKNTSERSFSSARKRRYRDKSTDTSTERRRQVILPSVALSHLDKASQLLLSVDQLTCRGVEGGYRMIRATHGVHTGSFFWECEILPSLSPNGQVRLGWATRFAELQANVGYDKCSFGYCGAAGSKCHNKMRIDNYGQPFTSGDIIGCYLKLDDVSAQNNEMRFFHNGIDQGIAYSGLEIPSGVYFPAISLYMEAQVRVNFGPSFILKHDIYAANAYSEAQPMSPEDRKIHEARIADIRASRNISANRS